jgi:hypothetical protein
MIARNDKKKKEKKIVRLNGKVPSTGAVPF